MKIGKSIIVFFSIMIFITVFLTAFLAGLFAIDNVQAEENPESLTAEQKDSYHIISLADEFSSGSVDYTDAPSEVSFSKSENNYLLIKAESDSLNEGRLRLDRSLIFDRNPVGRISLDGYAREGATVYVDVYLDKETEPVASFLLPSEDSGDIASATDSNENVASATDSNENVASVTDSPEQNDSENIHGSKSFIQTVNVYDRKITGEHKVSLGFRVSGDNENEDEKEIIFALKTIEFAENSLPVVYLNIDESKGTIEAMNKSKNHSEKCCGKFSIQVPDGYISEYSGNTETDYSDLDLEYIKGRGNSSWAEEKKSYKIKLDKKADLFGMGANKHWVLLANSLDVTQMRNRVTYWLGSELGLEFTPQSIPVEVVMNNKYLGTYFLSEHIRVGEGRVEIDELEENDEDLDVITGGYFLAMCPDEEDPPENKIVTASSMSFLLESPDFTEAENEAQKNYISNYLQKTEDAIFGDSFKDTEGKSYKEYIDFDSLIDYWWIQEFSINTDAYDTESTYLYKKRSGKLYFGPLWDFDFVAWGSQVNMGNRMQGFNNTHCEWINRLKKDPEFLQAIHDRWSDIDVLVEEIIKPEGLLDKYYEEMKTAESYNSELWSHGSDGNTRQYKSYEEAIQEYRSWITERRDWINDNIEDIYHLTYHVTFSVDGETYYEADKLIDDAINEAPESPKKKGYVFSGWKDENGVAFDPNSKPKEDVQFYAAFVKLSTEENGHKRTGPFSFGEKYLVILLIIITLLGGTTFILVRKNKKSK